MKILSLFDEMACSMLAMIKADIAIDNYVAYEIDKYAIKTSTHNFPIIEEKGDVFNADFREYEGFDYLVGGSPCTYWSIAQTKNRETEASGQGWELFSQYVRALREAKPKYFIYENNKSMSNQIRQSITNTFGLEPICINSALVSAQNRQRLYWVGIRQEDGTYKKADIKQPEDRGILLKDILETSYNILHEKEMDYMVRDSKGNYSDRWTYCQKPGQKDKSVRIPANIHKGVPYNIVAEPICLNSKSGRNGIEGLQPSIQDRVYSIDGKHTAVTTSFLPNIVEAVHECFKVKEATKQGYVAIEIGGCVDMSMPNSKTRRGRKMDEKSNCLQTSCEFYQYCGTVDTPIYEVKDGMITVKGKQYPIKLVDEFYIIRKLTVRECMRLQTVPEWYEFPVSNSQAYKMLGNGWTIDVITHIINELKDQKNN